VHNNAQLIHAKLTHSANPRDVQWTPAKPVTECFLYPTERFLVGCVLLR